MTLYVFLLHFTTILKITEISEIVIYININIKMINVKN